MINVLILSAVMPLLRRVPRLVVKAVKLPFRLFVAQPFWLFCSSMMLVTDAWCQMMARVGCAPKHYQALQTSERLRKSAQLQASELQELRDQLEEALATKAVILEKYRIAKNCYKQLVQEVKEMEAAAASASRSTQRTKAARMADMSCAESLDAAFSPGDSPSIARSARHLRNSHQLSLDDPHSVMWSTHTSMLAATAAWLYWWSMTQEASDAAARNLVGQAASGMAPAAMSASSPNVILAAYRTKIFTYTVLVAYLLWVLRIIPGGRVMGAMLTASAWTLVGWCVHAMAMADVCGV